MIERLLILVLVALLVLAAWGLLRLWRRARLQRLGAGAPLAGLVPLGRPAVVAFSTPACAECSTRQAPALTRLARLVGDSVTIRTVSALDHPELVRTVGVLTVPSTVVVDARGVVRHLNLGYSGERALHQQVRGLGAGG